MLHWFVFLISAILQAPRLIFQYLLLCAHSVDVSSSPELNRSTHISITRRIRGRTSQICLPFAISASLEAFKDLCLDWLKDHRGICCTAFVCEKQTCLPGSSPGKALPRQQWASTAQASRSTPLPCQRFLLLFFGT